MPVPIKNGLKAGIKLAASNGKVKPRKQQGFWGGGVLTTLQADNVDVYELLLGDAAKENSVLMGRAGIGKRRCITTDSRAGVDSLEGRSVGVERSPSSRITSGGSSNVSCKGVQPE